MMLLLETARAATVPLCNTKPGLTKEMYALYPVANTDECMNQAAYDTRDRASCIVPIYCGFMTQGYINERADRCRALRRLLSDQSLGINARIPVDETKDYVVRGVGIDRNAYSANDFMPLNAKLVKWRSVALSFNPGLPQALFGGAKLSFSRKTFVNGASGVAIVEGLSITTAFKNDYIVMNGCSLPVFDFSVKWHSEGDCWTRAISVEISSTAGRCLQQFSSNDVRLAGLDFIQAQDWDESGLKFPLSYAQLIFKCAQDGRWSGQTYATPGACATCASIVAKQSAMEGVVVISCNRTLQAQPDCCAGCNPSTHMQPEAALRCVLKCAPGSYYTASGWCAQCPNGQFSKGGLAPCLSCGVLLGNPNSIFSDGQCRACGSLAAATPTEGCAACPSGKNVPMGASTCMTCAAKGHFVSSSGACVPCAPGTYFSGGGCLICPSNTVAPSNGSTSCANCAIGHSSSMYTKCVPCPPINASSMPFAQYYQSGCNIRCTPGASYVRTSPYIRNGCGSCASVVAPVGTFLSATDCTITRPCTSAPPNKAHYITNGTHAGGCEWKCNAGFQRAASACAPCNFGPHFSSQKHVIAAEAAQECKYTCRPGLYVDLPHLFCNVSCLNLLDEVSAGRIKGRVREYDQTRPNYVQGRCGTNETMPRSNVLFLRFGRWAYLDTRGRCGNSLLNANEECDDGNTKSGDGCSGDCRVELSKVYKWECDLIGAPCVRDCGWTFKSPAPNGVGLIGFYLPPNAMDCKNLSYRYNVEPLPPYARAEWMNNNLRRCTCGARTLPFSECNATNHGCRECGSGSYHDDLAGKCVMCGSACSPGFTRGQCSTETPSGCVGCPAVANGHLIRYIRGCAYGCISETSYCDAPSAQAEGICTSRCASCEFARSRLTNAIAPAAGYYPKGCSSETNGYAWAPCDASSKPAGALWESNSESGSSGCAWKCASNYVPWRGTCVPTFKYTPPGQRPCAPGQRFKWSEAAADEAVCLPCVGAISGAYQIWTSDPPSFEECRPECNPSVSYRLNSSATECLPCSNPQCAAGEYAAPCTIGADAVCLPCAPVLSTGLEYAEGCRTRCVAGYSLVNDACVDCALLPPCPPGQYNARPCECVDCATVPLPPNAVWSATAVCQTQCAQGFIARGANSCQVCDPTTMCPNGGECSLDAIFCYAVDTMAATSTPVVFNDTRYHDTIIMGGVARPDLKYPTRLLKSRRP
jgi:cysteine-rich repeat protein